MPKFIIFSVCFLFITNIFAENGDELTITGDIVNLRSDPASDTDALIKLLKGRKVIEIQRQDDWVEIETHRKDIKTGWVHKSLVAKETEKLRTISISPLYKRFMRRFNDHNEVIRKQNGVFYFSDAKEKGKGKGKGIISVIATEAWLNAEREERGESLNEIFKLWNNVVPVGRSMSDTHHE